MPIAGPRSACLLNAPLRVDTHGMWMVQDVEGACDVPVGINGDRNVMSFAAAGQSIGIDKSTTGSVVAGTNKVETALRPVPQDMEEVREGRVLWRGVAVRRNKDQDYRLAP